MLGGVKGGRPMTNSPSMLYGIWEEFPMESEESVRESVDIKKHHHHQKGNTIIMITTDGIVEIRLKSKNK